MKVLGSTLAALLMAGTSVHAAEPDDGNAAREEKKICKTEKMTGSLTKVRRTCLTQRQWDELATSTRRGVDDVVRAAGRNTGGSSNPTPGMGGGF